MTRPSPEPRAHVGRDRTVALVLDAAEAAFAEGGYDGASVRDITERAGVRLAAVSDRFGGKEALFEQVMRRRGRALEADRLARLADLPRRGSRSRRVRALVLAHSEPALGRALESPGWRHWFRCVVHLAHAREPVRHLVEHPDDPDDAVAAAFVDHLADLYPDAAVADLVEAHRFVSVVVLELVADPEQTPTVELVERHRRSVELLRGGIDRLCRRSHRPVAPRR